MSTWLVKSAPDEYSIELFEKERVTQWTGVRNYQARNNLKAMKKGETLYFYYSQISPPAIVAECRVERSAYPDPTQFDRKSDYYDSKATMENPRWYAVDLRFVKRYKHPLTLDVLRGIRGLSTMALFKSSRLSVQPITPSEHRILTKLVMKGK